MNTRRTLERKMKAGCLVGFIGLLGLGIGQNVPAASLSVNAAGGANYSSIGAAINAAQSGDTIKVAPGTYTGPMNRNMDFRGKKLVVYSASSRSTGARETCIIDCQRLGRAFVFCSQEDKDCVLDGFVIQNAYNVSATKPGQVTSGGAILCINSSPRIINCRFGHNLAVGHGGAVACLDRSAPVLTNCHFYSNQAGPWSDGGALYSQASFPSITKCSFSYNYAVQGHGGGLACYASSPTMKDCEVLQNAADAGGGICLEGGTAAKIVRCKVYNNRALNPDAGNGGGIASTASSPWVEDCDVWGNTGANGGGVFCEGGMPTIVKCRIQSNQVVDNFYSGWGGGIACFTGTRAKIRNCDISGNAASDGGGVACWDSSPEMAACQIANNVARGGGGIEFDYESRAVVRGCRITGNKAQYCGGGIESSPDAHPQLYGCVIDENQALGGTGSYWEEGAGGGVACRRSDMLLFSCVVKDNHAQNGGGGLYVQIGNNPPLVPAVVNCTLTGNLADNDGHAIYCYKYSWDVPGTFDILNSILWNNKTLDRRSAVVGIAVEDPLLRIDSCDIEGGVAAIDCPGAGLLDAYNVINRNPLFQGDGCHLQLASPCLDSGSSTWIPPYSVDIDGRARIQGRQVDIGADESPL